MKTFFFITIFLAILCQPTSRIMAQNQQKNASQVIGELLLALLVSDSQKPAKAQTANAIKKSDILGVWEYDDCLLFIESNGNYSVTTPSYGAIVFSGTYKYTNNTLNVYNSNGALHATWKITEATDLLVMKPKRGGASITGTFKCSVNDFFEQKNRELANLEANTERFVTEQQGYIQSKTIRHDVQTAATRRSYDAERVKAIESAKYYRQQGNETQARAWEAKAADYEREINKLDGN